MLQKLTVVVTGATGKQGGAVARELHERRHKVRAVTRDPNSSPAKSLAKARATLVAAALEDTAAITKALEGATSLFAMTVPSGGADVDGRQGIVAADAAKAAGVHLVFTSVGNVNRHTVLRTSTASTRSKAHRQDWCLHNDTRAGFLHGEPLFHQGAARQGDLRSREKR